MKEELETGEVYVRIRSTRGTDTRDQDEAIVAAVYEDVDEAERESDRLNALLEERLAGARDVQPDSADATGGEVGPSGADAAGVAKPTVEGDDEVSKVYVGQGGGIDVGSWIPLPREVAFEEIAPQVRSNRVSDSAPHVKVNFSSDVPISGWTQVDRDVVRDQIAPLIERFRLDDR
ncbi:DUF7389 domain-containing protein [Halorarum salinum]|uniref:DUF7389 domain-containing protein n=1 Tax=Halorarum salinum TaxID=2743089 RepID=A0A7D5L8J8_9EURY|nr:hypothetical protein [Halobaculum salinum]QLG60471.1 hypothetical protein HUG12_01370 [Halobaculum salinum]